MQHCRSRSPHANEFASPVWQWVRNRQIRQQKYHREHRFPAYAAGFCCVVLKLILEVDGTDHIREAEKRMSELGIVKDRQID